VIDITAALDRADAIDNLSGLIEFKRYLGQAVEMQPGCARITRAICGSVNLILIVDVIALLGCETQSAACATALWSGFAPCRICYFAPNICSLLPTLWLGL
jgi:hypothetical protein